MVSIVIATHGGMAKELLRTAEMIVGNQENIAVIDFEPEDGNSKLKDKYTKAIENLNLEEGLIFLVDLFGGSPFNVASQIAVEGNKMDVVTGVNVPMLLEVLVSRLTGTREEVVTLANTSGVEGIKVLSKVLSEVK